VGQQDRKLRIINQTTMNDNIYYGKLFLKGGLSFLTHTPVQHFTSFKVFYYCFLGETNLKFQIVVWEKKRAYSL
jgi:hypothetical protein